MALLEIHQTPTFAPDNNKFPAAHFPEVSQALSLRPDTLGPDITVTLHDGR